MFAFEIENVYISPSKIAILLNSIDSVCDVRTRKLFRSPCDIHNEFKYLNKNFIVYEPYGDSSRYWIGPKDTEDKAIEIKDIENVFKKYKPLFIVKIFGDIISLNFRPLFERKRKRGQI